MLLSNYGASKVININSIDKADSKSSSKILADLCENVSVIIFSNTYTAKTIAPRLSVKLEAAFISNVISLTEEKTIKVQRQAFSTKAFEIVESKTSKTILSISPNSFGLIESKSDCNIERIESSSQGEIVVERQEMSSEKVSLSEAEIIVSGGRGLKGPENWKMVEELASCIDTNFDLRCELFTK